MEASSPRGYRCPSAKTQTTELSTAQLPVPLITITGSLSHTHTHTHTHTTTLHTHTHIYILSAIYTRRGKSLAAPQPFSLPPITCYSLFLGEKHGVIHSPA